MRIRAGGIIIKEDKILLIYRYKPERGEYYIFPGGGVEEGESIQEACIREMKEELSLDVELGELYHTITDPDYDTFEGGMQEHYFLIKDYKGNIEISGPELERLSTDDVYKIVWMEINKLRDLDLAPIPVVDKIIKDFNRKSFSE